MSYGSIFKFLAGRAEPTTRAAILHHILGPAPSNGSVEETRAYSHRQSLVDIELRGMVRNGTLVQPRRGLYALPVPQAELPLTGPPPACAHCGGVPGEALGAELYPYRPDLAATAYWHCRPCRAWVPQEPRGGRPANAGLRRWRRDFHAVFDPLWRRKMERDGIGQGPARAAAYQWLASEMGMDASACHGAFFNLEQATTAYVICRRFHVPS